MTRSCRATFIRIKVKGKDLKVKSKDSVASQTVMDDKFIKLTTKDDANSKINQLAKLREENLKRIPFHDKMLDQSLDAPALKEIERLKLNSKIDIIDEPLTMFSFLKEALYVTTPQREDKSKDYQYNDDIRQKLGKSVKQIREEMEYYNIERQVNQKFDIKVSQYFIKTYI